MGRTTRILALALTLLVVASAAGAEVVQQFNIQIKDLRSYGGYTVVVTWRNYDTTGAAPPPVRNTTMRFPAGIKIKPKFLKGKQLCDVNKLRVTKDPATCKSAQMGSGTVQVDGRPDITEVFPARFWLFLGRPDKPGAVARMTILAISDPNFPFVKNNPSIRDTKPVFDGTFYNDPTPDGKYGYRLEIPAPPVGNLKISLAEIHANTTGLTRSTRSTKCKTRKRGRCAKRKTTVKKEFWLTKPPCPPSGRLTFDSLFSFESNAPSRHTLEVPCPRFTI